MTKIEALARLKYIAREDDSRITTADIMALEIAIQALSQEPCDDAVSRDELLKAIDTWDKFGYTETGCFVREPKGDYVPYIHYDDVIKCIKGMPSVTQKSGKWQVVSDGYGDSAYICECSECKDTVWVYKDADRKWNYCPNCGAKMESEVRNEKG